MPSAVFRDELFVVSRGVDVDHFTLLPRKDYSDSLFLGGDRSRSKKARQTVSDFKRANKRIAKFKPSSRRWHLLDASIARPTLDSYGQEADVDDTLLLALPDSDRLALVNAALDVAFFDGRTHLDTAPRITLTLTLPLPRRR